MSKTTFLTMAALSCSLALFTGRADAKGYGLSGWNQGNQGRVDQGDWGRGNSSGINVNISGSGDTVTIIETLGSSCGKSTYCSPPCRPICPPPCAPPPCIPICSPPCIPICSPPPCFPPPCGPPPCQPPAVPEPTSLFFFGLLGLGALRRKLV